MKKTLLQFVAAMLSAVLLGALWEPFRQTGAVWFALVPLLLLVRHVSPARAWWFGFVVGFGAWAIQLAWMLRLSDNGGPWMLVVPAWLALSAVLGLFIGGFAGLAAAIRRQLPARAWRIPLALVVEPILWAGFEVLRSNIFTGFAWNPLGLACIDFLPLLQPAAVGGVALVSALLVAVNGGIATWVERGWGAVTHTLPTTRGARLLLVAESLLPLAALLCTFLWGSQRIQHYVKLEKPRIAVAVVQGTQAPSVFSEEAPKPLWELAEETVDLLPFFRADLWLWPESATASVAFPYNIGAQDILQHLAQRAQTPLFFGGNYKVPEGWYNAALLVTAQGLDHQQVYGKRHLVPFGEYIPFDKDFPALQRLAPTGLSNIPGKEVTTVRLPSGLVIGPLICFEDTVASVARESVLDGAQLLVNMSNDAWYSPSPEGIQHAQQAVLRAIETGVPMMRSTNGGVNTVIDAVGRQQVIESIPTRIGLLERPYASAYLTWGEWVFGAPCVLITLCWGAWFILRRFVRVPQVTAATALLVVGLLLPGISHAQPKEDFLPIAGMAMDDGNITLAERTARRVLAQLGISPEERARAQEILIRAALSKEDWAEAEQLISDCPELAAERRLVFMLAISNGKRDYAKTVRDYEIAALPPDDVWGVSALRMVLHADLALGKKLAAAERFAAIDQAKGADDRTRAENALLWAEQFPNSQSRAALLNAAKQADRGGVFLDCALALPEAFAGTANQQEALTVLDQVLEMRGLASAVEARLALAATALATETEARITYARRAVETAREEQIRRQALAALGELLCEDAKTTEEGLALLRDAVHLNPSAEEAPLLQLQVAEYSARAGAYEAALEAYNRWLESYDKADYRVRVRQGKARALMSLKRPEEALATLTEAAELAETKALRTELILEAADAAIAAKRYTRAITLYRGLLTDSTAPDIHLRLARCYEAAGETDQAMKAYSTVRDDPSASEETVAVATTRLGALLSAAGRHKEAIAEYTRLLGRVQDPARRNALRLERGRTHYTLGELTKAKEDFAAIREADPAEVAAEARFFLVLCLYGLGEDEEARTLAQEYVTARPDAKRIPDIVLWIAKSDFNRGDYSTAAQGFEDFAKRWPDDPRVPQALLLAARAAYQNQDYSVAVERVGRLAKDFPQASNLADARFLQCEALMELARYAEARDLLEMLIRTAPDATWIGEAYGRRGDCLALTATDDPGRYPLALSAYREALTRLADFPDSTLMYSFKIGRILERQGLHDEAADHYNRLLYRVLNQPNHYSEIGLRWAQKTLTQLRAIEIARGNRNDFETLLLRIREARIPGLHATH